MCVKPDQFPASVNSSLISLCSKVHANGNVTSDTGRTPVLLQSRSHHHGAEHAQRDGQPQRTNPMPHRCVGVSHHQGGAF